MDSYKVIVKLVPYSLEEINLEMIQLPVIPNVPNRKYNVFGE